MASTNCSILGSEDIDPKDKIFSTTKASVEIMLLAVGTCFSTSCRAFSRGKNSRLQITPKRENLVLEGKERNLHEGSRNDRPQKFVV